MVVKLIAIFLFVFSRGIKIVRSQHRVFDIRSFGAKNDRIDNSQAVLNAWNQACISMVPSTIYIPNGTYSMSVIEFKGPCKASVEIKLDGILKAPTDPSFAGDEHWVTVSYVDHFTLSGDGTLDGQGGVVAWKTNDCHKGKCSKLPYNLSLNYLVNATVTNITSLDSKKFHVGVNGCSNLRFVNFNIISPADSPNTDGIHIARSNEVYVIDSVIKTGDDCVSIGDGAQDLQIEGVTCGPGHGISVGSLGKYSGERPVVGISVKNCTLMNTTNGIRIKTWPDAYPCIVSDLLFEDIIMDQVSNPILIEQEYCPYQLCSRKNPSRVKVSNVRFKNIRGTTKSQVALKIGCSAGFPCEDIEVSDIDLSYNGVNGFVKAECSYAKPKFRGKMNVPACLGGSVEN